MRTHIAKALQSRCKAIRNAVKTYNAAAVELDPPRPQMSWEAVSHINFLEEFHLLHNTRNDIREKPWSQPAVRELMKLYQRVKRAHEELERCHIAIRRLYTSIHDEDDDFKNLLSKLQTGDLVLYGAVRDFVTHRRQVNGVLLAKLKHLTSSSNYSGNRSRGVRVGREAITGGNMGNMRGSELVDHLDHDGDDVNEELGVDEADELVGQLVDYVSDLTLLP
jgi:hypothetical protein